jgi:hypothetical protein
MPTIDTYLLDHAQADITALAHLPKTYAATVPAWAGQVTQLPPTCHGASASDLCDGWNVAVAAYGPAISRGTEAFAYLWRRFGPPWWGSDPDKDLVRYLLHTADPDIFLSLALRASSLPYSVGYVITPAVQEAWYGPDRLWRAQFEGWWTTFDLTEQERATVRCQAARGPGVAEVPLVRGLRTRFWNALADPLLLEKAAAALGPRPASGRHGTHLGICTALHDALVECLRPVFIRDIAINILGRVPDDALDERDTCESSVYAGYGIPKAAMDASVSETWA